MANSSNPYAPDETAAQIFNDETWLQGELLSCVAYGVELTLFVMCFGIVVRQINRSDYKRQLALLSFVTVLFGLGTTFMITQAVFTQIAFVRNRNFPGGPGAFEEAMFSVSPNEISIACFIVGNWLMDTFLVWRYTVIYRACATAWRVVLIMIPCLMLCASIVLGIMALVQTSRALPFRDVDIMLSYYVMSVSLNIIVTLLIVGRLFYYRRWMFKALGRSNTSVAYANIATMLIESASLYSVFAILFLVPFGMGNALGNVFLQTVSQVQTISSLLIIYRVATGRAWSEKTTTRPLSLPVSNRVKMTTLQFTTTGISTTSTAEDSEATKNGGGMEAGVSGLEAGDV